MAYNDDEEDLNRWLGGQAAPSLSAPDEQQGAWQRAAQMLAAGNYGSEPAPKANDISWKTVLGMVLSKDPGAVMLADQEAKRRQIDDWAKRNSPEAMFDRQMALSGMLRQQDAQQFNQDRATAADIRQANRDEAADAQQQIANKLARDRFAQDQAQFDASQSGMDRRQAEQLAATRSLHESDQAAALQRAMLAAQAKAQGKPVTALPGTDITDQNAYRQYMQSPANVKALSQDLGTSQRIRGYLDRLQELRSEESSAANAAEYNNIIKFLIGDQSKEGSTGVLSNTEFERYIRDLPGYGTSKDPLVNNLGQMTSWRGALDVLNGKDPASDTLSQLRAAYSKAQDAKFSPMGVRLHVGDAGAQPPPAADTLPTTAPPSQWRNAPKVDDLRKLSEDDQDLGVTYGR